jgi:hypothetical protein
MRFYLGTHEPAWLRRADVPLFISRRRFDRLPAGKATCRWAIDSGGFTELSMHGKWVTSPEQYVDDVRAAMSRVGPADFVSIQDWMCEPHMITRTGLSVEEHQARSVESYRILSDMAPEIPWMPVVQGWTESDYLVCIELYRRAGVDLRRLPVVGVGSVCRRQGSDGVGILLAVARLQIRVHAFGFKKTGLPRVKNEIVSSDSMAWSLAGRRAPDPTHRHQTCANCFEYAMRWRSDLLVQLDNTHANA